MDLFVESTRYRSFNFNKGDGKFEDDGLRRLNRSRKHMFLNILVGTSPTGSSGTTENFVRIGHSLLALIAAFLGGLLSRYFFATNRMPVSGSVNPQA